MATYPFQLKKTYSFDIYPSAILGADFNNCTVLDILSYTTASKFTNLAVKHPLIYPTLPQGYANDPTEYTYLMVRTEAGDEVILANEWIRQDSITEVQSAVVHVKLTDFPVTDIPLLRTVLAENGFKNFTVTQSR